ncbi:MAG: hypothetical protein KA792_04410 [Bacteroidales bacterium]|nr:hypothetical protein [Bacteroidales bacterium]
MAKVMNYSLYSMLSGKLGDKIFYHRKFGNSVSQISKRKKNKSSFSEKGMKIFIYISKQWQFISEKQRKNWLILSKKYFKKNKMGYTYNMSPYNLFLMINYNRFMINEPFMENPPDKIPLINKFYFDNIKISVLNRKWSINISLKKFDNPDFKIILFASKPRSAGLFTSKQDYRKIAVLDCKHLFDKNLAPLYFDIFKINLQPGKKIFFKFKPVHIHTGFDGKIFFGSAICEGNQIIKPFSTPINQKPSSNILTKFLNLFK